MTTPKRWKHPPRDMRISQNLELPDFQELTASAGAEAQAAGKPRSACPHARGTAAAADWLAGWTISKADLDRR